MHLKFRNVNDAFSGIVAGIHTESIPTVTTTSRVGDVLQIVEPVIITYEKPLERVLLNRARDTNVFFHMFESLWLLAGRKDVASLAYYNSKIAEIASDDGVTFNGAYGYRWRHARGPIRVTETHQESTGPAYNVFSNEYDQLKFIIDQLRQKPDSRRCVLQMWNVWDDLLKIDETKDTCCNTHVYFLINNGKLDMTVCNRSNDLIWGALGANAVHFSVLLEYMAAQIGVGVGVYNQMTNNLHAYKDRWYPEQWLRKEHRTMHSPPRFYYDKATLVPLVSNSVKFDSECTRFVEHYSSDECISAYPYTEPFLATVAQPMCEAFCAHKQRDYLRAELFLRSVKADDWRTAGVNWIKKRADRYAKRCGEVDL